MKRIMLTAIMIVLALSLVMASGSKSSAKTAGGPDKLTYWAAIQPTTAQVAQSFADNVYFQELMKRTNTDIEFQHVSASGNVKSEGFNILIASGDYPDIIEYTWTSYPGGPQAAIDDKVIIPLNDVVDKYAPNFKKFLETHPDVEKMVTTDDGTLYVFPFLRGESYENNNLIFSEGWVWRPDLLRKAGISEIPETADELYDALVALKGIGVQIPLCLRGDHLSRSIGPAFDSTDDFYVEDGVVKYGKIEKERKDYLEFANKLYSEGLLDNDYLSVDKSGLGVKVLNGMVGVTYAPGGQGIGTWLEAMKKDDPSVEMVSSKPLTAVKGRLSKFAKMNSIYDASGDSAAITTACKNIEAAARLLDYNYSEEGNLLVNFGIEGLTYNMIDGYPTYTDLILHNPDGLTITQALNLYTRATIAGPMIQDPRYLEQYYDIPELQEAIGLWKQTDYGKYILPPVSYTSEEAAEIARIINNVNTYASEMEAKFVSGALPISEFDNYVAQLKAFGIERAIELTQAAYDRYMAK